MQTNRHTDNRHRDKSFTPATLVEVSNQNLCTACLCALMFGISNTEYRLRYQYFEIPWYSVSVLVTEPGLLQQSWTTFTFKTVTLQYYWFAVNHLEMSLTIYIVQSRKLVHFMDRSLHCLPMSPKLVRCLNTCRQNLIAYRPLGLLYYSVRMSA